MTFPSIRYLSFSTYIHEDEDEDDGNNEDDNDGIS